MPDLQQFMNEKWEYADNNFRYIPSYTNGDYKVKAQIKAVPDIKAVLEKVEVRAKNFAGNNELGVKFSPKEVEFHLDAGFRRQLDYNFNTYYKTKFSINRYFPNEFILGLNFNGKDSTTHHELSLLRQDNEVKIQLRNSSMMIWKFVKLATINMISYAKQIESSSSYVVSLHPIKQLAIFGIVNKLINGESNYNAGLRYTVDPRLTMYGNVHINPYLDYSHLLGASFDVPASKVKGKFYVQDFTNVNVHLETTLPYQIKASLTAKADLGSKAKNDQDGFRWGVRIEQDF